MQKIIYLDEMLLAQMWFANPFATELPTLHVYQTKRINNLFLSSSNAIFVM